MVGAGVPDTSHTSVVGWPDEVKTLGSPTSSTGAEGERERGGLYMYLRVESKTQYTPDKTVFERDRYRETPHTAEVNPTCIYTCAGIDATMHASLSDGVLTEEPRSPAQFNATFLPVLQVTAPRDAVLLHSVTTARTQCEIHVHTLLPLHAHNVRYTYTLCYHCTHTM